jgi:hypothetical protein
MLQKKIVSALIGLGLVGLGLAWQPLITVLILAVFVLVSAIVFLLVDLGWYFAKPRQGHIIFIDVGESQQAIVPNLNGFGLSHMNGTPIRDPDGRLWLVPEEDGETATAITLKCAGLVSAPNRILRTILWNQLGAWFIGWTWPFVAKIHQFDIRSRQTLVPASEGKKSLGARIESSKDPKGGKASTVVESLRFIVPRPILLKGIALPGENAMVNLLILVTYRCVIPTVPVYDLNGDFFAPLDGAVESAVVDFMATHRVAVHKKTDRFAHDTYHPEDYKTVGEKSPKEYEKKYDPAPINYNYWLKLGKGSGSPIERRVRRLNVGREYLNRLEVGREADLASELEGLSDKEKEKVLEQHPNTILIKYLHALSRNELQSHGNGIVAGFGFAMTSFRLIEWEADEVSKKLMEAVLLKETNLHEAEAARRKAQGERDALAIVAEGERQRNKASVEPLVELGVNPDMAAEFARTDRRTANIRDGKVTTYVEGGGKTRAGIMIPSPSTAPKTDPNSGPATKKGGSGDGNH